MRICVLSDEEITDFDPTPYLKGFEWEMVTVKAPVDALIRRLVEEKIYDVFLNICEGHEADSEEPYSYQGIDVVKALEVLGVPFTGTDSRCFDPTREQMQAVAEKAGLGFAKGYHVTSAAEAEKLVANLRYPIMVKHPKSYGSTGMTRQSRCDSVHEVRAQVQNMIDQFGAARMEEFIVGTEYNVLVVDNAQDLQKPIAYPPAQLVFPPNEEFWHVDVKWNYDVVFDFNEVKDPALIARLHELATRMYLAMGVTGYGRCDIRMNDKGEMFLLEINPNGGIMFKPEEYGPADYMILYDPGGYKLFFDRIIAAAFARQKERAGRK